MNIYYFFDRHQFKLDYNRIKSILYTMSNYFDVLSDEEWQSHCNSLILVISSLRTLREWRNYERDKESSKLN